VRDDELMPVICPTCQMLSRIAKTHASNVLATLHGVVFDILVDGRI
jgi:hypothetical protein